MELRQLQSPDVWQMTRVLRKFNLKDAASAIDKDVLKKSQFKAPMKAEGGELVPLPVEEWTAGQKKAYAAAQDAKNTLVWQILGLLMDNIGNCEGEVNKLLSMGTGESIEAITELPAQDYLELIVTYVTREDFADFFTFAVNLLSKQNSSRNITTAVQTLMR